MNRLIFQNFPKFEPKLAEKFEKLGDFAHNVTQNRTNWYMNESLFLEKLVFVWYTFKFHGGTALPKPNLSTTPGV